MFKRVPSAGAEADKELKSLAPTSCPTIGNTPVVRRITCILLGHSKTNNKCQRCGEQFGIPKMPYPPAPP
jgi:predicted RNA-binding Zn-ribbon protein involved in translation (DUF1610 family)